MVRGSLRLKTDASFLVPVEELWIQFFNDPSLWWDNRGKNCNNDFRHASSSEELCISSCPTWLQPKLASLRDAPSGEKGTRAHFKSSTVPVLLAALKQCGKRRDLQAGKRLHLEAVGAGCYTNKYVGNALISMYSRCKSMPLAREVFDNLIHRDVVSWNSLILGYVENGENIVAMHLFKSMDCEPDSFTFVAALKACTGLCTDKQLDRQLCLEEGMTIHKQAKEREVHTVTFVANTLVDMYSKCGSMMHAQDVFDSMSRRDVVSWTSLILGYAENGESREAMNLYSKMDCEPDSMAFVAALNACTGLVSETETDKRSCLEQGMSIHKRARECGCHSDTFVANALVDMYIKSGSVITARTVFDSMRNWDIVSWNSLIVGYVENGENELAMELFTRMECEPSSITFVAAVKACGCMGQQAGQVIHAQICKLALEHHQVVANCLVDMYAKCGNMDTAEEMFGAMQSSDLVSWNALIAGYSSSGNTSRVFNLVEHLLETGLRMDSISLILVLSACSHAGMVEEGKKYFDGYTGKHYTVEHYTCMIDMLGRANRLQEALAVVKDMPVEADIVVWKTLLGACRTFNNVDIGKIAFDNVVACDKRDSSAYVMMEDIYTKLGMVQDKERLEHEEKMHRA